MSQTNTYQIKDMLLFSKDRNQMLSIFSLLKTHQCGRHSGLSFNTLGYLGSEVVCVGALRGCEVGTDHSFRHVDCDHQALHRFPHGLLGSDCDFQATTRSCLKETDALFHVHWEGHKTEEGMTYNWFKQADSNQLVFTSQQGNKGGL